jgi:hypothetical protein
MFSHSHTEIKSSDKKFIALTIWINDMWKNIEKDTTEIVYDNKTLHIAELEDKWSVFILFLNNKR